MKNNIQVLPKMPLLEPFLCADNRDSENSSLTTGELRETG
jgi:hypothetical protein